MKQVVYRKDFEKQERTYDMDKLDVRGTEITIFSKDDMDSISLTDMLKAKDGDFFISDWLRNSNTVEFY